MMLLDSPAALARLAGLTYVVLIVSGIFGIAHVPASLIQWDDPGATIANIKSSEFLFRIAIACQLLCFISFVVLPVLLYRLLANAYPLAGFLMVAFALISVPVLLMSSAHHINVLHLIGDSPYLQALPVEAIQLQVMSALAASNNCATVTNIFAGLWLLPFGYLIIKSGVLPKILGYLLILGGVGYLYEFITGFILEASPSPWYVSLVSNLGVFVVALWLFIAGARAPNKEK